MCDTFTVCEGIRSHVWDLFISQCVVERGSALQNAIVTSKAAVFRVLICTWEGCMIIRRECIDDIHDGVVRWVTNVLVDIVVSK